MCANYPAQPLAHSRCIKKVPEIGEAKCWVSLAALCVYKLQDSVLSATRSPDQ